MKLKIKKGDTVEVVSGAEKGKKGAVLAVEPKSLQIKVQGVKVMTHFDKKEGAQKKLEGFFPYSKVKLVEKVAAEKKKASKKKASSKNA